MRLARQQTFPLMQFKLNSLKTASVFAAKLRLLVAVYFACGLANPRCMSNEIEFVTDIQPLLTKYCAGCHNQQDRETGFAADSFENVMLGSENGKVVNLDDPKNSQLLLLIYGKAEPKMPPDEEAQPTVEEKKLIADWITKGAKKGESSASLRERVTSLGPVDPTGFKSLVTSSLRLQQNQPRWIIGQTGSIELRDEVSGELIAQSSEVIGSVNSIRLSSDGQVVVVGSGVPGVGGQVSLLKTEDLSLIKQWDVDQDSIYAAAMSPDQTIIATAGYERTIRLWDVETGNLIAEMLGHNGAVYDLDFSFDGDLLCSASADETVKLWNIRTHQRLDTFGQCEGEQYTCRFDSEGNRVYAGGADRRVRVWKIVAHDKPAVNPLIHSAFAHEASVLSLRISPDGQFLATGGQDHTYKVWTASDLTPVTKLGSSDEIPVAINWNNSGTELFATTIDGERKQFYFDRPPRINSTEDVSVSHSPSHQPLTSSRRQVDDLATRYDSFEDSNDPSRAQFITLPARVRGKIDSFFLENSHQADSDSFRFKASKGMPWVMTVTRLDNASPLDSHLEILDATGEPLLRTRLQAVRETYFTFRAKNSTQADDFRLHRWEDMELNELLYANGEVCKLWLYPRGPDSGFKVYPGRDSRTTYFGTTASTHALNEPAFIVRELSTDEQPSPNGLPVFPIYFQNDDDPNRQLGVDSRLVFVAPYDGEFTARIRDTRGLEGALYKYQFDIRPPRPDFNVSVESSKNEIVLGSGTELEIVAQRFDDFSGQIDILIKGLPDGFTYSEPLFVERSQISATAAIYAPIDLEAPPENIELTIVASAMVDGKVKTIELPKKVALKIEKTELVRPRLVASGGSSQSDSLKEIVVHPGETVTASVVLEGGENKVELSFGTDDCNRNFPHGIIVSNIGLSGLLIPQGQNEREFFITAAPWVEPQERPIHLQTKANGKLTTQPVLLRVVANEERRENSLANHDRGQPIPSQTENK